MAKGLSAFQEVPSFVVSRAFSQHGYSLTEHKDILQYRCGGRTHPMLNPLTPNDLQRRRAVSPLKIKISSKNMREKPTNTQIIYSVY
jgi:hypothetical protein